jgi:hypothetical protein
VGPRIGLDDMEKRKFLIILGLEFDPFIIQPIGILISTPPYFFLA